MEVRKMTIVWFPTPLGNLKGIGFVGPDAVPAFEDLLARVIVAWGFQGRIVDPTPRRVVTSRRRRRRRSSGGVEEREEEEE